ncbi:DMT family transporter [Methanobacterium alcaliphilum]|uniref:DMT family transporter n=1 Tax=Methanobacterium alcaliphilum TaxID=392018 RepID=UPI002009DF91|nr:DMT family transporter [Methanobacterium alcaliphilum]MCK9150907.1 DMT family transporter [Methanobacterium alcaliphilum]
MNRFWGYLSIIMATLFFGISATFNKIMLQEMHPLPIAALTYTLAGVFLFSIRQSPIKERILDILNKKNKSENFISKRDYGILIITAISSSVIAPLLYLNGLSQTTAVNGSLLLNLEILFIIILSLILFDETFKKKDVIGIIFLVIGAVFLATKGEVDDLINSQTFTGSLLIIGAAVFWSIDIVLSKFLSNKRDLIWISGLKSSIGGISLLFITGFFMGLSLSLSLEILPFLLFVSIFSVGSAFILVYFAIREIGATRVGSIFPLSSLFGAFFAFIILNEPFGILEIILGLLMVGGVFILYWDPEKTKK